MNYKEKRAYTRKMEAFLRKEDKSLASLIFTHSFLKEVDNPVAQKLCRRIEAKKLTLELARQDFKEKMEA